MKANNQAMLCFVFLLVASWHEARSNTPEPTVLLNAAKVLQHPEFQRLTGKWIVRSVKRDGEPNQAQVGQQVGDIITINPNGGLPYVT